MIPSGDPTIATRRESSSAKTKTTRRRLGKRKRLTAERREKIREVRRQGACLRCKMLRISCSKESPCESCLSSAAGGSDRKVLSFCYCVRTRFIDIDIFDNETREDLGADIIPQLSRVLARQTWDTAAADFDGMLVDWLRNPATVLPNGSIVHALLSAKFSSDMAQVFGADTSQDLRIFIFATSLARTQWDNGGWSCHSLRRAARISGSRIIQRLDHFLAPQFIAKLGGDERRVVFLFLLGVILGIGYFGDSMDILGSKFRKSPTLWLTMRERICQILAHHLIFIASTIGVKLDTMEEQSIINGAVGRWNKTELFGWARQQTADYDAGQHGKQPTHRTVMTADSGNFVTVQCDDVLRYHNLDLGHDSTSGMERPEKSIEINHAVGSGNPDYYSATEDFDWQSFSPKPFDLSSETRASKEATSEPPNTKNCEEEDTLRPELGEKMDSGIDSTSYRRRKRRSIWIVRPFDAGGDTVSVHARYGVVEGQTLGLFA